MEKELKVIHIVIEIILAIIIAILGVLLWQKNDRLASYIQSAQSLIELYESNINRLEQLRKNTNAQIDTVYIYIDKVRTEYEKSYLGIISNSISDDYKFFVDYIDKQGFNSNYRRPVKKN